MFTCPVKERKKETKLALIAEDRELTYKELNELVEEQEERIKTGKYESIFYVENTSKYVAYILALLRQNKGFFSVPSTYSNLPKVSIESGMWYMFTTGTTGIPKIAVFDYQKMFAKGAPYFLDGLIEKNDYLYCSWPLSAELIVRVFKKGSTLSLLRREKRNTYMMLAPHLLHEVTKEDYPNLRLVSSAGTIMNYEVCLKVYNRFKGEVPLYLMYGSRELGIVALSRFAPHKEEKILYTMEDSVQYRIPEKKPLQVLSKVDFLGYIGEGSSTIAEPFVEVSGKKFLETPDLVERVGDKIDILGRADYRISSGTYTIDLSYIKKMVSYLDYVNAVDVKAVDHKKWGKRPYVYVSLKEGKTVTDLIKDLLCSMHKYCVPREDEIEVIE